VLGLWWEKEKEGAYIDASRQVVPVTSLPETTCCGRAAVRPDARLATRRVVKYILLLKSS
jgi:hypothetical protein